MHEVIIVGAGPAGLTAALDLAQRGVRTLILEQKNQLSESGSRAIVIDNASLTHFEQLGCVSAMMRNGLVAKRRRTYFRETELFSNEFPQPANAGELPRFLNIPQTETERILLAAVEANPSVEIRWGCTVTAVSQNNESVHVSFRTPFGDERVEASFLLACDGCRSPVRKMLGLGFPGYTCPSQFLIVDIHAQIPRAKEHHFHFDHPSNPGMTILTVPQPEDIWRIDWQLPCGANTETERCPKRLKERTRAILGNIPFELVWTSSYRFHQRIMDRMSLGRVFFLGDAAHILAPFGARGMNSGIQDARNISWKIAAVINGVAPPSLLDTYNTERLRENRAHQRITRRTMRFVAPENGVMRHARDFVLRLSGNLPLARKLVDSGKMSNFPITKVPA